MRLKLFLLFLPLIVTVKAESELNVADRHPHDHVLMPFHAIPRPIPRPILVQPLIPTEVIEEPTTEPQPLVTEPVQTSKAPGDGERLGPRLPPARNIPRPVPRPHYIGPIPDPVVTELPPTPATRRPVPRPTPLPVPRPRPIRPEPKPQQPKPLPEPILPPQPEPIPEPIPLPQPEPIPEPIPLPQPEPIPEPEPLPKPEPHREPEPIPEPNRIPRPIPVPPRPRPQPTPEPLPQPKPIVTPKPAPKPIGTLRPYNPVKDHNIYDSAGIPVDYNCVQDGFYGVPNECDSFIDCYKRSAMKYVCPDGLYFNKNARWPEYPCAYPSDEVRCELGAVSHEPRPTAQCLHQYGFFAIKDSDCSRYISCQEGLATIMDCPPGLVFNDAKSTCDWPENVPNCQPNVFKGFSCPPTPLDEYGEPYDLIYKYKYGKSCKEYIACQRGHPRLLSCDPGLLFDEESETCIDAEYVKNCSP